jgi:hypothetical protein
MNSLESRKKLLIAESELNRAQLVQEWQTLTTEVHAIRRQAATVTSLASASVALVAGLGFCRRKRTAPVAERPSWWRTLLTAAQLAIPLWLEFRARPK